MTRSLVWNNTDASAQNPNNPTWGQWLRQVEIKPTRGDVLMNGADTLPLLVLDRVEQGRVAQLASDHVWLWSRYYDGGGPHTEFLRRIVHWLMKEPELDDRALDVQVEKNTMTLSKRNLENLSSEILSMTDPQGEILPVELKDDGQGKLTASLTAPRGGIYAFEDRFGARKFAIIGDLYPPEFRAVVTTDTLMKPVTDSSGGGALWLEKVPAPKVRFLPKTSRHFAGGGWIGLRINNDYAVAGVKDSPILPHWISLLILLCAGVIHMVA